MSAPDDFAHTATVLAVQEGPKAVTRLRAGSALRWSLVALLGSALAVGLTFVDGLDGRVVGGAGAALLALVALGLPRVKAPTLAARLALLLTVIGAAAGAAGADTAAKGFAVTFASSWAGAELLAFALHALDKRRLVLPLTAFVPGIVSTALVYALPAQASPLGAGLGALAACVLLGAARVGEHAVGWRHGADQLDAAAASRIFEPGRALWLALSPDHVPERTFPADARVDQVALDGAPS